MLRLHRLKTVARCLFVSALVGMAMAGTAYLCAWKSMRNAPGFRRHHVDAFFTVRTLKAALDDYRKQNGRYPERLADLKSIRPDEVRVDEVGEVLDPWNRPYNYRAQEKSFTLLSFGRDGNPGGEGLDQDIDALAISSRGGEPIQLPAIGIPTLRQFTFDCPTGGVRIACALSGLFAFVACLVALISQRNGHPRSYLALILTLGATLVTAFFMSLLHYPSNH